MSTTLLNAKYLASYMEDFVDSWGDLMWEQDDQDVLEQLIEDYENLQKELLTLRKLPNRD